MVDPHHKTEGSLDEADLSDRFKLPAGSFVARYYDLYTPAAMVRVEACIGDREWLWVGPLQSLVAANRRAKMNGLDWIPKELVPLRKMLKSAMGDTPPFLLNAILGPAQERMPRRHVKLGPELAAAVGMSWRTKKRTRSPQPNIELTIYRDLDGELYAQLFETVDGETCQYLYRVRALHRLWYAVERHGLDADIRLTPIETETLFNGFHLTYGIGPRAMLQVILRHATLDD